MKTIKSTSKKAQNLIKLYNESDFYTLCDIYRSYSKEKYQIWYKLIDECIEDKGTYFKIISFNTFTFNVMWKNYKGYKVKTKNYTYQIEIEPF